MKLNGRRVWGVLCVGGRQVRGLLVGACAALCGQGVEASSFRVGEASLPTEAREAVGTGGEAPFDLSRRRRAALLTAPSPDQIGLPEVSPELQQTPTLKP